MSSRVWTKGSTRPPIFSTEQVRKNCSCLAVRGERERLPVQVGQKEDPNVLGESEGKRGNGEGAGVVGGAAVEEIVDRRTNVVLPLKDVSRGLQLKRDGN